MLRPWVGATISKAELWIGTKFGILLVPGNPSKCFQEGAFLSCVIGLKYLLGQNKYHTVMGS